MYLISTMSRPDVWPIGDYGVRVGWTLLHGLDETISEKDLLVAGERFVVRGRRSRVLLGGRSLGQSSQVAFHSCHY